MDAKGLKFRIIQNVSLKKPAIFHWRFGGKLRPNNFFYKILIQEGYSLLRSFAKFIHEKI